MTMAKWARQQLPVPGTATNKQVVQVPTWLDGHRYLLTGVAVVDVAVAVAAMVEARHKVQWMTIRVA